MELRTAEASSLIERKLRRIGNGILDEKRKAFDQSSPKKWRLVASKASDATLHGMRAPLMTHMRSRCKAAIIDKQASAHLIRSSWAGRGPFEEPGPRSRPRGTSLHGLATSAAEGGQLLAPAQEPLFPRHGQRPLRRARTTFAAHWALGTTRWHALLPLYLVSEPATTRRHCAP